MTDAAEQARDLFVDEERPDGELRSPPNQDEVEQTLREAERRGAKRAIEHIYERFCGMRPDAAGYVSRHVRVDDVLEQEDTEDA